jgi:hypothetical protein
MLIITEFVQSICSIFQWFSKSAKIFLDYIPILSKQALSKHLFILSKYHTRNHL